MDRRRFSPSSFVPTRRGLVPLASTAKGREIARLAHIKRMVEAHRAFLKRKKAASESLQLPEGGREPVTIPNEAVSCGFCGALVFQTGYFRAHSRPDGSACSPGIPLTIQY